MPNSIATNFLHAGTIGDVVAALPVIRENYRLLGKKANLYLVNGQRANYYAGAVHPTVSEDGHMVMLNDRVIKMMIPLFEAQECINQVKEWEDEEIDIDLNKIRDTFVNMPNGCISRWYFYVYPDLACDLTEKWLTVPETDKDIAKNKFVISRTERYLNLNINYSFLKPYEDQCLFSGTELERVIFNARYGLSIKPIEAKDFLELAQGLSQCKAHISNQTSAFQMSQGLKVPRVVELCSYAPNVIPIGANAYDFYAQEGLEFYFHKFNGTTKEYFESQRVLKIKAMQKEEMLSNTSSK